MKKVDGSVQIVPKSRGCIDMETSQTASSGFILVQHAISFARLDNQPPSRCSPHFATPCGGESPNSVPKTQDQLAGAWINDPLHGVAASPEASAKVPRPLRWVLFLEPDPVHPQDGALCQLLYRVAKAALDKLCISK